jgi:hypothetical protein
MIVGINETRDEKPPAGVHHLGVLIGKEMIPFPNMGDYSMANCHGNSILDPGYIDIDQSTVFDDKVGWFPPHGCCHNIQRNFMQQPSFMGIAWCF